MQTVSRLINTFVPENYNLSLALEREARTFSGTVTITGESLNDSWLRLHSKDLTIDSVVIDGHAATHSMHENDELEIRLDDMIAGKHTVVLGFSGKITDAMHGIYPCYFDHDGVKKELLATQFESHHAREVFPCVDEPEAKATFDLVLTTERDVTVIGNMPLKDQRVENGYLVSVFEQTPRMSSYLLAWVVGELQKKSAKTKRGIEVNVWATPAQASASLDFPLDFACRTLDYFEDYFGIEYPLPKSDHVALPDFTSGAMENWGLITYREIALLADPKTASIDGLHYVATVISHELSHQWFGNLVTMKWWDNLWLNESFANFIENLPIDAMYPEWNIWMDYASSWSLMALRRDSIDGVQPVQTEVNHPDEITSLFDGAIVYGKGGRLIGMLREYVGEDHFRAGLKHYFKTFAYQNTTGDDLWDSLESVSGKPVREFMNQWVLRPGYPVVYIESDKLWQEQFFIGQHQPSSQVWPIPLAVEPRDNLPAILEKKEVSVTTSDQQRFNVGNWSHFITHYSDDHFASLLTRMKTFSPMDRLQLINERTLLARAGTISSAALIPAVEAFRHETHDTVWGITAMALGELKKFVEADLISEKRLRAFSRHLASEQFERLGWDKQNGEPENDTKLRPIVIGMTLYGEEPSDIDKAISLFAAAPVEQLDPELRALLISTAVRHGNKPELVKSLLSAYTHSHSAELRDDISSGLTSTKDPEAIRLILASMKDSSVIRPQDVFRWFAYLVRGRDSRELAWQWLQDNWTWVEETFGGDKSYDDFPRYAANGLLTRKQLEEYKDYFTPMLSNPALKRTIELGVSEIEARVELIAKDSEAVYSVLAKL